MTSGTLSPLTSFASELGIDFPIQFEAQHVVDSKQIWCNVISRVGTVELRGTYEHTTTNTYKDSIGRALLHIVQSVPDGVLCFFSSYTLLNSMIDRWKSIDLYTQISDYKKICIEYQNADKLEKERQLFDIANSESKRIEKGWSVTGGLFLAVSRGKLSEGIDFSDASGRAVVLVGMYTVIE